MAYNTLKLALGFFYINIPVGITGVTLAFLLLPPLGKMVKEPIDMVGLGLLAVGLGFFTLGIIKGQDWGWNSEKTLASFLISAPYLIAFFMREVSCEHPLLDFSLFRIRNFTVGIFSIFIMFTGLAATLFLLPFFLQGIKGLSAEESGYWLLAIPVAITFLAPVAGRLSDRINPKVMMCLGPIIFSAGLYLLNDLDVDVKFWKLAPVLSIIGVGMALVMPVAMNVMMTAVPQRKAGMASGTIQTFNSLGQAMGVTFGGVLFTGKMNDLIPNYGNQLPSPLQIKFLEIMAAKGFGYPLVVMVEAFMDSFRHVFISEIPLILAGFLIILLLLRGREHLKIVKKVSNKNNYFTHIKY